MSQSAAARKFVSKWIAVLFILTGVSGVILLAAHPGRGQGVSHAVVIWKHIHELSAILFLITALIHIYFNGKILVRYFRAT